MNNEENIQDKVDPSSQSELTSQDESTSQGELVSEYEPEPNTAYLTRFEALCGLIEARSETLLNDWSTDDLISLYSQLRSVPLTDEGISTIVENFQDTSFEEISEVITAVKDLIVENESLRFQHKKFTVNSDAPSKISLSETELEADRRLLDFVTSLTAKKKVHGSTTERLKELFKMFANEAPPTKKVRFYGMFLIYFSLLPLLICFVRLLALKTKLITATFTSSCPRPRSSDSRNH
jgi:hypothetical protein